MTNVLIYSMGRVGSISIKRSLARTCNLTDCHYAGSIPPKNKYEKSIFNGLGYHHRDTWHKKGYSIYRRRRACSDLINEANHNDVPLKIITLVRSPLEQAFSRYLYNFRYLTRPNYTYFQYVLYGLRWFDYEFLPNTGVDVYSQKFDVSQGYSIIRRNNIHILIIKSDLSNRTKEFALADFGLFPSQIIRSNTTSALFENPVISQAGEAFVRAILENPNKMNQIQSSRLAKHFFSESEVQEIPSKALTYIRKFIKY